MLNSMYYFIGAPIIVVCRTQDFADFVCDISNARMWLLTEKSLQDSHLYNSLFFYEYSRCRNLLQLAKLVIFLLFLKRPSWSTGLISANKVNVI